METQQIGVIQEIEESIDRILTNDEIDEIEESLMCEKNSEGWFVDAFGKKVAYNGLRAVKPANALMNLTKEQQREIEACARDYKYFRKNYCKILTREGVNRPELREYQVRAENDLLTGEDTLLFFPRQCIAWDTNIVINSITTTSKDFFDLCNNNNEMVLGLSETNAKFIKSIKVKNKFVSTPNGEKEVLEVHKTIPYRKFKIILSNGLFLEGAYNHVVIDNEQEEVYMKDSLGKNLITVDGVSTVVEVIDLEVEENMYDISIDSEDELYFSNGILSHNSGKTVLVAEYLLYNALFRKDINIGIAANVIKLAREVLDKIKKIYVLLPFWLQQGVVNWNKSGIELENGTRIMSSASTSDSFRGFTLSIMYCSHEDEEVTILCTYTNTTKTVSLKELNKLLKSDNIYKILTKEGFKNFNGLKKTTNSTYVVLEFDDDTTFKCTTNHRIEMEGVYTNVCDIVIGNTINGKVVRSVDIIKDIKENVFYDPINVEDTSSYIINGMSHHNCDETAFLKEFDEFVDAVVPSMSSLPNSQAIYSSTANGMNHWFKMVTDAKKKVKKTLDADYMIELDNGDFISVADYKEIMDKEPL